MSRIGNKTITIPAGVEITVAEGNEVTVKGPKGTLSRQFAPFLTISVEDGECKVIRPDDNKTTKQLHGTTRALLHNMVVGVSEGFEKRLELVDDVKVECASPTEIVVSGIDKQKVGEFAANIRAARKPEPYKGKGIRYKGEYVRRKEGKTAGKK